MYFKMDIYTVCKHVCILLIFINKYIYIYTYTHYVNMYVDLYTWPFWYGQGWFTCAFWGFSRIFQTNPHHLTSLFCHRVEQLEQLSRNPFSQSSCQVHSNLRSSAKNLHMAIFAPKTFRDITLQGINIDPARWGLEDYSSFPEHFLFSRSM